MFVNGELIKIIETIGFSTEHKYYFYVPSNRLKRLHDPTKSN